jgi:murein DD-endopeptidase MepM/ murein hydrolase activator NlpD
MKKAFTPITIMFVPHSKSKPLNFKIPFVGIVSTLLLSLIGVVYIFSIAIDTYEYYRMKKNLNYYSEQFSELKNTISALKRAEAQFTRLFSHESKEDVLKSIDSSDSGSIDMENLKQEIKSAVENIGEIKDYLRLQHDIYVATPKGFPVDGAISSQFGNRVNPIRGGQDFHSGLDISSSPGDPVRATAEGIVSFSGWNGGSGNLVVLEHGHGFSTFYAHNKMNVVKVGQKVKRGDIIAYVGSTGSSTGPHVHYEIWKEGNPVDPTQYKEGRS